MAVKTNQIKANIITDENGTGAPSFPFGIAGFSSALGFRAQGLGYAPTIGSTIIWTSIDFNVGGHYNLATGRFTAPETGIYSFSCGLVWGAGATKIHLYINGVSKARMITQASDGQVANVVVYLTAGDLVDVRPIDGTLSVVPGGNEYSHFMGFKVN